MLNMIFLRFAFGRVPSPDKPTFVGFSAVCPSRAFFFRRYLLEDHAQSMCAEWRSISSPAWPRSLERLKQLPLCSTTLLQSSHARAFILLFKPHGLQLQLLPG